MPDKRKNIVLRFGIVYVVILFLFLLVIYRIVILQFVERDGWIALAAKNKKSDIVVEPNRGNIFACDGRLLASSIPSYYIYMDTRVPSLHMKNGELFKENIDSVSICLANFFGDRRWHQYKSMIKDAYGRGDGALQLQARRISYSELKEIQKMPLFRLGRNKSGLITREFKKRVNPFGSLAARTIGGIYANESKAGKNGLELHFNEELKGKPGVSTREKIANRWEEKIEVEPIDGTDIISTIDIDLQDIAEKALLYGMNDFKAGEGYAILMEVESGEVKAIVNMQRNKDGSYSENKNGAVSNLTEPGSTFKVASLMALLDDGKAKITDTIDTYSGLYQFSNRPMKDHNYEHGGYHKITLAQAIYASSNIGISRAVEKAYGKKPSEFVDKLYEMKLNEPFDLEIPGSAAPKIRHPKDENSYWSNTTLPWMSIGYETQIPPIYTLAFYNAIANDGKYISPIFVKATSRNGHIQKRFEAKVIKSSICSSSTLKDIKGALLGVVEDKMGTAQNVKSKYVRIAGKSGTAQISQGKSGYKAGGQTKHLVSFCGYFPYENPLYTCIVVMIEPSVGYASGGHMSGSVFKKIAEQTMAIKSNLSPKELAQDTTQKFQFVPMSKSGNYDALRIVLKKTKQNFEGEEADWVRTYTNGDTIKIKPLNIIENLIPDLKNMGAKDAMYLLSEMGVKVQLRGKGKVVSQDLLPGSRARKGQKITLILQ